MFIKIIDKAIREIYRLFHPKLWFKNIQINGIPRIYDIKNLKIGRNVAINTDCVLQCYGGLNIGNNVTISDGAKILTRSLDTNNYCDNAKNKERYHIDKAVVISDGVWIAANVVVLSGVHIAKNIIVGAGSVVTRDLLQENSLYAGVPAGIIHNLVK